MEQPIRRAGKPLAQSLLGLGGMAVLLFSLQACQNVKFEGLAKPLDQSFQDRLSERADK